MQCSKDSGWRSYKRIVYSIWIACTLLFSILCAFAYYNLPFWPLIILGMVLYVYPFSRIYRWPCPRCKTTHHGFFHGQSSCLHCGLRKDEDPKNSDSSRSDVNKLNKVRRNYLSHLWAASFLFIPLIFVATSDRRWTPAVVWSMVIGLMCSAVGFFFYLKYFRK